MSERYARHLERGDGRAGGLVGACYTVEGPLAIVVVAGGADVRLSEVAAGEAEVVGAQRSITALDRAEVRSDVGVVSDTATRIAPQVTAEAVQA